MAYAGQSIPPPSIRPFSFQSTSFTRPQTRPKEKKSSLTVLVGLRRNRKLHLKQFSIFTLLPNPFVCFFFSLISGKLKKKKKIDFAVVGIAKLKPASDAYYHTQRLTFSEDKTPERDFPRIFRINASFKIISTIRHCSKKKIKKKKYSFDRSIKTG